MPATALRVTTEMQTGARDLDPLTMAASIERAIARGEHREALARCARAYGGALGRLCMAFTGSQAEAEELVQETLLAAHDAFAQYPTNGEPGGVKAFLFTIGRRVCARAVERRARGEGRPRLVSSGDGEGSGAPAINGQRAVHARTALDDLRPTEREALLLRYGSELSFLEVATACGCDEAAARKRVGRGLSRMRELLKNEL